MSKAAKSTSHISFLELSFLYGRFWWLTQTLVLIIGIILVIVPILFPEWITRSISIIPKEKFHIFIGIFLIAIPLNHIISHSFAFILSNIFKLTPRPWTIRENIYPPAIIGFFETVMYPTFLLWEKPELIGGWLLLKVAGGWKQWQAEDESRRRFYKFLIGNLITIWFSVLIYGAILSFVLY